MDSDRLKEILERCKRIFAAGIIAPTTDMELAATSDVPALLAEVERLRAENARQKAVVDVAVEACDAEEAYLNEAATNGLVTITRVALACAVKTYKEAL